MKASKVLPSLSLLFCCASAARSYPNTVELALMSSVGNLDGFQYYVNFTVGTPGQPQTLIIDTGSTNIVVFASNASFCKTSGCDGGTFDPSKSSTYEKASTRAFKTSFMGGNTWFGGDYVRDVIQMSMHIFRGQAPVYLIPRVSTNLFCRRPGYLKTPFRACV